MDFFANKRVDLFNEQGVERRKFPRCILRVKAQLSLAGGAPMDVRTLDIGIGGLAMLLPINPDLGLPAGAHFPLMFTGQPPFHIDTLCTVVGSFYSGEHQGFQVGLKFDHTPKDTIAWIAKYVHAHL